MLEYLIRLPTETLGHNILGFLEIIDIIQLENAAASSKSQQLLKTILPYCPTILFESAKGFVFNRESFNWFNNRRLRVQHAKISINSLCEVNYQHRIYCNIELFLNPYTALRHTKSLNNPIITQRVTRIQIIYHQDPTVMELLFALFSSVRSLDIVLSNLSEWMEHIKKIQPYLRELTIHHDIDLEMLTTITEYCPYLEKLSLYTRYDIPVFGDNILQTIAINCPRIHSVEIKLLCYNTSAEADADLTAFAEKCPQLEELSLNCGQLTDESVIALAQHCSRLKKLSLYACKLTAASLIALSERGLPLEELDIIPWIPIPSAEIAAQCAHALSRIRKLSTQFMNGSAEQLCYALQYMTGLRRLNLGSSEDHLLVPHLLLLLQGQCCAGLESLTIEYDSSITHQQLNELGQGCCNLKTLSITKSSCTSDAVLVELARSCPHLQEITLECIPKWTAEGVLALAAHCRQLREINIPYITVTEETVRQLAQHCRRLTKLIVKYNKQYFSKEIRVLRDTERAVALRL